MNKEKSIALVLAGCGAKDGSEITEAVSLMIAFNQAGFNIKYFAPNRPAHHTVNHLTNDEEQNNRNILIEAARIARGKIEPIENIKVEDFKALIFAGGFGVAKNLCNYAFKGQDAILYPDVKEIIFKFIQAEKTVGALCIAPVMLGIAARELGIKGAQITLGNNFNIPAVKDLEAWGGKHVSCNVDQACTDRVNKFVTAPAYMCDNVFSDDIYKSAVALVAGINSLI